MIWVFKHFPLIKTILLGVPECFASVLKPSTTGILEQRRQMGSQIDQILKDPTSLHSADHETIYHHFLTPQPDNDRHPPIRRDWLLDEGLYLRFAGSDTVGNTCTVATYHVLHDKDVHRKLTSVLLEAWPDKDTPTTYETLEKLPYLVRHIFIFFYCQSSTRVHFRPDGCHKGVVEDGTWRRIAPSPHRRADRFRDCWSYHPRRSKWMSRAAECCHSCASSVQRLSFRWVPQHFTGTPKSSQIRRSSILNGG